MKKYKQLAFWLIIGAVFYGIYKIVVYQVDMYYSKLAADQMNSDAAYTGLKSHDVVNTILLIVLVLGYIWVTIKMAQVIDEDVDNGDKSQPSTEQRSKE